MLMLLAMVGICVSWAVLFAVMIGLGVAVQRLTGIKTLDFEGTISTFWFGWCLLILILQTWHLFARISSGAFFSVLSLSAVVFVAVRPQFPLFNERKTIRPWIFMIAALLLLWLANRAMAPIRQYDAGLYHLSAIRWISEYPIVPGLGNLHDRLGFNSSYFLFEAMLDIGFWAHRSHHLAGGLLLLVVTLEIGFSIYKAIVNRPIYFYDLMRILFLAPVMNFWITHASSTSPDLPMYLIGALIGVRLCRFFFTPQSAENERTDVALIVVLAAAGVTVKLSFLILGTLASLVACWKFSGTIQANEKNGESFVRSILMPVGFASSTLLLWAFRNVILTGYPLYPSALLAFPVDWKMSVESLTNVSAWIQSWARNPSALPGQVLANWDWLQGWAANLLNDKFEVILPCVLFLGGTAATLVCILDGVFRFSDYVLFIFPAVGGLIFWFIMAPDPRYAGAAFWYLAAGAVALGYGGLCHGRTSEKGIRSTRFFVGANDPDTPCEMENYTARS